MNKNLLTIIISFLGFALYVFCVIYTFNEAVCIYKCDLDPTKINDILLYFTTGLTTMTGGIIAIIFGIPKLESNKPNPGKLETNYTRLNNVGSILYFGKSEKYKTLIGAFYTVFYTLVGFASIVFWIIAQEETTSGISNIATAFFGLLIPILSNFLKPDDIT